MNERDVNAERGPREQRSRDGGGEGARASGMAPGPGDAGSGNGARREAGPGDGGAGLTPALGVPRAGRISTGCAAIDSLLGGGFESAALSELFGEAGSGKTNLCLQMSRQVALLGKKTAYIDTEGVSVERLSQICADRFGELARNILFFEAYGMKEQESAVEKATRLCESSGGIGLLVLDSTTIFYRMSLGGEEEGYMRRSLAYQLTRLLNTSRRLMIPALITTQVYQDLKREMVCPIGGHLLDHGAKAILRLEKVGRGARRAVLCKHRSMPEGAGALFYITERGLEDRPGELPDAAEG